MARAVLELPVLIEILEAYAQKTLWSAVGWFLEEHRSTFFIADEDLALFERHRPRAPQYLESSRRGGTLLRRWNLIIPDHLVGIQNS